MTSYDIVDKWRDRLTLETGAEFEKRLKDLGIIPVDLDVDLDEEGALLATWIPMNHSSNVQAIAYNPINKRLLVSFRRKVDRPESVERIYQYFNIPETIYDDIFSAGSPGGAVWDLLRRSGHSFNRL